MGLQLENVTSGTAAGADRVFGGTGTDRIYGQGGQDVLRGEGDADDIEGGPARDTVHGDDGADTITGGSGVDMTLDGKERTWAGTVDTGDDLFGDAGGDTILGDNGVAALKRLFDVPVAGANPSTTSAGDDVISGGSENDRVFGQSGNDTVGGDAGLDVVDGNSGADTLNGGDDADVLVGGSQQSRLSTESGAGIDDRDRSVGGAPARGDLIHGDAGDDVVLGDNGRVAGSGATAVVEEYDVWRASAATRAPNASGADQLYGDTRQGPDVRAGPERPDVRW